MPIDDTGARATPESRRATDSAALVGGAVGKDVGDHDNHAAGAAAGAYAGNQVQKKIGESHTPTTTEVRCEPRPASN